MTELDESNTFLTQSKELRDKIQQDGIDGTELKKQMQDIENKMNVSIQQCTTDTQSFASSASIDVQKLSEELEKEVFKIMEKLSKLEANVGEYDIMLFFSLSSGS